MLNKIILFVVNQYSVIMQRNCPWLFMFAEKFSNREAERNRPRPRIQRLPATHLKLIEHARSNQGNTVLGPLLGLPRVLISVWTEPRILLIWMIV